MLRIDHPQSIESDGTVGTPIKSGDPPNGNKSGNGAGEGTNGAGEGDGSGTNGTIDKDSKGAITNPAANGGSKAVDTKPASDPEGKLAKAYKELYDAQNAIPPNAKTTRAKQDALQTALEENGKANLENNKKIALDLSNKSKKEKVLWINGMISDVGKQIELLEKGLEAFYKASTSAPAITEIVKKDVKDPGQVTGRELVSTQYAEAGGQFADPSQYPLGYHSDYRLTLIDQSSRFLAMESQLRSQKRLNQTNGRRYVQC